MSQTAALYYLQTLDNNNETGQKRLDEIQELLGRDEAMRAAQSVHEEAEAALRASRGHARDLELEMTSLESKIKSTEERLYNGSVSNPRELQNMQDEIASLRHRIGVLEEQLLEAMAAVEEQETNTEVTRSRLEAVSNERTDELGTLTDEKTQIESRLEKLAEEIRQAREHVLAEHLRLYDDLRKKRKGMAVAQVIDGVCGVCGVAPTSSQAQRVRHGEVECCPTCGRILYMKV